MSDIPPGKAVAENMRWSNWASKGEIIELIVRLGLVGIVTYFGVRWLVDALDPTQKQKKAAKKQAMELMKRIGTGKDVEFTEYELSIAAQLVDPLSLNISWGDIGGLDRECQEVRESIIFPLKNRNLYKHSQLLQPPKGVLLYGPPGCGKTMLAKAIAKDAGCRFINLQASTLTDKWYGESQKLASAVFSLATKLQPSIIFIDEIDSFLRSRGSQDHEATAMMKAQFMTLWDGLASDKSLNIIVMGATNRPQDVDSAILRRMPSTINIGLPNEAQRLSILQIILRKEKKSNNIDFQKIAEETDGFSGSDLRELCRDACMLTVRDIMRTSGEASASSELRPVEMNDMEMAARKMRATKNIARMDKILPLD